MIAKVTASGSGAGGLVDYLYDGRKQDRKRGDKDAEILLHSENLQMPRDADDMAGRRALKHDFDSRAKEINKNFKYVGMHVLSFTKEDMKKLNPEKILTICKEYVELAGLEKTQYFALSHSDTDNYHVHFVFNRLDNRGVKMDSHYEKLKTMYRAAAISLNHNLTLKGASFKVGQSYQVAQIRANYSSIKHLRLNDKTGLLLKARSQKLLNQLAQKQGIKVTNYFDQQKDWAEKGIKKGDVLDKERVNFNQTKIGTIEYRNEDLRAIYVHNVHENSMNKTHNAKELEALNLEFKVEQLKYSQEKSGFNFNYILGLGAGSNHSKKPKMHSAKIAGYKIKIQKLEKQKGIKI